MTNYAAGKAYVSSLTRALRHELAPHGIGVTLVNPGPTLTEFGLRATNREDFFHGKPGLMSAGEVADAALEALFAGRAECVPGWVNQSVPWLARLLPTSWMTRLGGVWMAPWSSASPTGPRGPGPE